MRNLSGQGFEHYYSSQSHKIYKKGLIFKIHDPSSLLINFNLSSFSYLIISNRTYYLTLFYYICASRQNHHHYYLHILRFLAGVSYAYLWTYSPPKFIHVNRLIIKRLVNGFTQ